MSYITVCTPTYNRAYLLHRPFESLMKQTFKDFEWLIIDDGSTDNTEEVIKKFCDIADFKITYVKQENQGRAAALNTSYDYINTKYVINLDSDDEYLPDTLEKIHDIWESIPKDQYSRFWCITGHSADQNGKIIGRLWPERINEKRGRRQHKEIIKYKGGEKSCCRKTEVLRQNRFPKYPDTKFVPEDIVWEKINKQYDQYCVNETFRIYHTDSADSLISGKQFSEVRKISYYYYYLFYVNECQDQFFYNRISRRAFLDVSRLAILTRRGYRKVMGELKGPWRKVLVSIFWPAMFIFDKLYYK